jgi:CheY-like chemotaxis protein
MTLELPPSARYAPRSPINILLLDDTPAKLLTYEVILSELGENLIKATSADEAFQILLKTEVALVLTDVSMPSVDGFEFAKILRGHPRFEGMPIVFVSAIAQSDVDRLQGYASGAVRIQGRKRLVASRHRLRCGVSAASGVLGKLCDAGSNSLEALGAVFVAAPILWHSSPPTPDGSSRDIVVPVALRA